ncbi:ParA family protein [Pseudomonas aeruginosa]|uniref:ParA family protein n=1 Tax=Pseudomonas aeruginosa TaxID=287 RepID=UPI00109DE27C|nr:ParA family protein [Pseudomonas aeruginosa]EKV1241252.1 ParA family protein [Pseudomonas aeruginosa]EKV8586161.1 ParA family protein [Pseudomonas aeruginosa]ELN5407379.1 ParA family protein [Pseudomonas aeruginosa]ELP1438570.1 ParA family protein [Pseudomonas aeruginosa]THB16472.1 ParA family protein [Pseudomonas aeruginosa]
MKNEMNNLAAAIARVIGKGNILAFISGKGGVMKSTNSQNLAAALVDDGYKVLIIDCDPQRTTYNWDVLRQNIIEKEEARLRERRDSLKKIQNETGFTNQMMVKQVIEAVKKLNKMKNLHVISRDPNVINWAEIEDLKAEYDFIIFDTSGHLEFIGTTKDIIKNSDVVFIPYNNSIDDFNVRFDVQKTLDSCGNYKAKVFSLVVDMNERQHSKGISQKIFAKLSDSMPLAPVKLFKRASWVDVKWKGLGVVEANKDKVAVQQFKDLASFVVTEINNAKAA